MLGLSGFIVRAVVALRGALVDDGAGESGGEGAVVGDVVVARGGEREGVKLREEMVRDGEVEDAEEIGEVEERVRA